MATPILRSRNAKLFLDNSPLMVDALQFSYLAEPAVVGDAQVFLQDYTGFADNQALLIEDFGSESAEISTINGTPSVGGGCVLDAVLVRSHPVGSKVYILDFDQIELTYATTATGTKFVLTTSLGSGLVAIQPDTKIQIFNDVEAIFGYYYFARYVNSLGGAFTRSSDTFTSTAHGLLNNQTVKFIQ